MINPPPPRLILSLRSSATSRSFIPPPPPRLSTLCHVLGMELLAVFTRGLGSAAAAAALVAGDTGRDMEQHYINKQAFTWSKHAAGRETGSFSLSLSSLPLPSRPWHSHR